MNHFASTVDFGFAVGSFMTGLVAILTGFYGFAWKIMKTSREEREKEQKDFGSIIKSLSKSIQANTKYLKDRNGRDAEIHTEQLEAMRQLNAGFATMGTERQGADEKILAEIRAIKVKTMDVDKQHVHEQVVDKVKK